MEVNEIIAAAEAGNIGRYLSGCICDQCGTSRYDIDLFRAIGGDYDAHCCDMEGYTV
jgi:hypothetical protein